MIELNSSVIFVAGDGAAGRIILNVSELLKTKNYITVTQKGGEAAIINPDSVIISPEGYDKLSLDTDCQCVVSGNSFGFWQLEIRICEIAFSHEIPVIRILDYANTGDHALPALIKVWGLTGKPPLTVTAITEVHRQLLLNTYPQLEGLIKVIGNPLHHGFEQMLDRRDQLLTEFRNRRSLSSDAMILSILLSGVNANQFEEMTKTAENIIECLAGSENIAILLNVHHRTDDEWRKNYMDPFINRISEKGIKIITDASPDEMVAFGGLSFVSPLSANGLKALCFNLPVLECNSPLFTEQSLELEKGSVLGANSQMSGNQLKKVIIDARDPSLQNQRLASAKKADIIPEPGALDRLCKIIKGMM